LVGSSFAALVFLVEKYVTIGGIPNYISSVDGLGINWLKQTYLYFIFSSLLYGTISFFDSKEQVIFPGFYLKVSTPSSLVNWLSVALLLIMLMLYWTFY
jgi:SSS family solute:Na+ symporter